MRRFFRTECTYPPTCNSGRRLLLPRVLGDDNVFHIILHKR